MGFNIEIPEVEKKGFTIIEPEEEISDLIPEVETEPEEVDVGITQPQKKGFTVIEPEPLGPPPEEMTIIPEFETEVPSSTQVDIGSPQAQPEQAIKPLREGVPPVGSEEIIVPAGTIPGRKPIPSTPLAATLVGLTDPIPFIGPKGIDVDRLRKEHPGSVTAGGALTQIGLALIGGAGVANLLGRTALSKTPILLNAVTRAITAGSIRGAQSVENVIEGKETIKEAMFNTIVESAGGAAFSVIPEIKFSTNAIQLILQPLADVMYQAGVDAIKEGDQNVFSAEWFKQQIPTIAAAAGFAVNDVGRGRLFIEPKVKPDIPLKPEEIETPVETPIKPVEAPKVPEVEKGIEKIIEPPVPDKPPVITDEQKFREEVGPKVKAEKISPEQEKLKKEPKETPISKKAGFFKQPTGIFKSRKQRVPEPAKKAHGDWVVNKQLKELESGKAINSVFKQLPKTKDREVIPFLIEKTSIPKELGRPDLEKIINDPAKKEKLTKVSKEVREHFHKQWNWMQENLPDMSAKEIENYVTHIWDIPKNKIGEATNWFITRNQLLKKRFIKTYEEGIKRGYKPKTLDIAKIIHAHDQIVIKTTENTKLVEALKNLEDSEGQKLIQRSDKAPEGWITSDHPVLRRAMVVGKTKVGVPVKSIESTIIETINNIKTITKNGIITGEGIKAPVKKMESVITGALEYRGMTPGEANQFLNRLKAVYSNKDFKISDDVITTEQSRKINKIIKEIEQKVPVDVPILQKVPVRYHPDLDPVMRSVFGKRFEGPKLEVGNVEFNPLQLYETVNALQKKLQLTISLFHHAALSETSVATIGPGKTLKIANPVKIFNAVAKNDYSIYNKNYDLARDAIKDGVQIGAISDVQRTKFEGMLENVERSLSKVHKGLGLPVKGVAKVNKVWDKALWDYLHNEFKLQGYYTLKTKLLSKLKNPTDGEVAAVGKEAAQFVNDSFGGQNWEAMMTDPKNLQMAQWALLSPDWTVSTIKQALAPTGVGAISKGGRKYRRGLGRSFWIKAAFYFYGGMNLLNHALTKKDDSEERGVPYKQGRGKWMYENDPGHKTHLFTGRYDDGSKRYTRWGKQFRELLEMFYDQTAGEFSPITASLKKIGGKAAPNLQLFSQIVTGHTLSGFKNRELAEKTGWKWVGAAAEVIMKTPLPFSFKNIHDEAKQFSPMDLAFPSSKGMTYYKTKKFFKIAIVKRKLKHLRNTYVAATENNLPAFDIMEDAMRELKREAAVEIGRQVRLGKISEPKSILELEGVTREKERAIEKKVTIENWEILLRAAEERYKAFLIEEGIKTEEK